MALSEILGLSDMRQGIEKDSDRGLKIDMAT